MTPNATQLAQATLATFHYNTLPESLALVELLVAAGTFSPTQRVSTWTEGNSAEQGRKQNEVVLFFWDESEKGGFKTTRETWPEREVWPDLPFFQTLTLHMGGVHDHMGNLYYPQMAQRMLNLDAAAFSLHTPENGWWLWHLLCAKSHHDSSSLMSRSSFQEWLDVVLPSLPAAAFEGPQATQAFGVLLEHGAINAVRRFVQHRPNLWQATDEKGKPLLRLAGESAFWPLFLENGDPWLEVKGRPFWRHLLPQASTAFPEPGTFRHAISEWVAQEAKKPHPHPRILDYRQEEALLLTQNKKWQEVPVHLRADVLKRLPTEDHVGNLESPLHAQRLLSGSKKWDTAASWSKHLDNHGPWKKSLDAPIQTAVWFLQSYLESKTLVFKEAPLATYQAALTPEFAAFMQTLSRSWDSDSRAKVYDFLSPESLAPIRAIVMAAKIDEVAPHVSVSAPKPRI